MPERSKRLRVLAGPNGSGKSTVVQTIKSNYYCGPYVNADDIQQMLDQKKVLNLSSNYSLETQKESFDKYISEEGSSWIEKADKQESSINLQYVDNNLLIKEGQPTGIYDAAIAADYIRISLLTQNNTFTFETVLSHPSKVIFLQQAKECGYKNYLYFVCTIHPSINLERVDHRVSLGGHDVPIDKILNRYMKSLELLPALIPHTYRAFLFDNSIKNVDARLIAEINYGQTFIQKSHDIPWWVNEFVIKKLFP